MPSPAASPQVAELATLIDAMPSEYREDVLLAALRLGASTGFKESYLVSSTRDQLSDCLFEKTGTIHAFTALRAHDPSVIHRRLNIFTAAQDLTQVTHALCDLLAFLIDVL
jgi:hypothetical protein